MREEKNKALKKCIEVLESPSVLKWYETNLQTMPQSETIKTLEKGIEREEITTREALSICLLVGLQWNVKFEGVP